MWIVAAIFSALFAGLTSILAKIGIRHTDSNVATLIRTLVILIFAWLMVFCVGSFYEIANIDAFSLTFLILSGLATGLSWLCYFKALSIGEVKKIVPIDKSSTVLTILLAMILFQETNFLALKLICTALIFVGTILMIEEHDFRFSDFRQKYFLYAFASAVFAALTAILSKIGIADLESNLGTAIRTIVVLVMAFVVVIYQGKYHALRWRALIYGRELYFIILSGIATGASWLCYYYAIQQGLVSVVVAIDKLSIVVSIVFAFLVFHEKISLRNLLGLGLIVGATLVMAIYR